MLIFDTIGIECWSIYSCGNVLWVSGRLGVLRIRIGPPPRSGVIRYFFVSYPSPSYQHICISSTLYLSLYLSPSVSFSIVYIDIVNIYSYSPSFLVSLPSSISVFHLPVSFTHSFSPSLSPSLWDTGNKIWKGIVRWSSRSHRPPTSRCDHFESFCFDDFLRSHRLPILDPSLVLFSRGVGVERIYDITYHISSSSYYSEDIHTKITLWYYSKESWPRDNLD